MQSYRDLLNQEFERRVQKNSHYSKRAFARDLGLSAAFLSQVLTAKKNLSPDKASEIATNIQYSPKQRQFFLNLVRLEHAKSDEYKAAIRRELGKKSKKRVSYKNLKHETFQMVANWYYHALLTLAEVEGFQYDIKWMAQKLGLSSEKVTAAIKVLKTLNLIEETNGTITTRFEMLQVDSIPSRAIREHHRQFLERAGQALASHAASDLDITGSTIAINRAKLPEARKLIKEFRENLTEFLVEPGSNTAVYRLSVQLFRLDRETPSER